MPPGGFELAVPVFLRAKEVHASDRAATVTGGKTNSGTRIYYKK
jgi:hypothetical protein